LGRLTFREVLDTDAAMILEWRTSPRVSSVMTTTVTATIDQQVEWIRGARLNEFYYHWVIQNDDKDIGLISINQINRETKSCIWGYYIGDDQSIGQGGLLPAYLYNWIFNTSAFDIVRIETFDFNTPVLKIHEMYGFEPRPSEDRLVENNPSKRLVAMALTRYRWSEMTKFHRFVAHFPTDYWLARPF